MNENNPMYAKFKLNNFIIERRDDVYNRNVYRITTDEIESDWMLTINDAWKSFLKNCQVMLDASI
jgi:hypothetical protein